METADIGADFDVPTIIRGLHKDLIDLRAGRISTKDAQTRADLAKQIFNGLRMLIQSQKFLSESARPVPTLEGQPDG